MNDQYKWRMITYFIKIKMIGYRLNLPAIVLFLLIEKVATVGSKKKIGILIRNYFEH